MLYKKYLLPAIFLYLSINVCFAQVAQEWVQRYNGPGNHSDQARSIAVDDSGNVYVTGASTGSGTSLDYATIKYNSSGIQQWVQRYNGPGNSSDEASSIAVDGLGNVYVTGFSSGSGTGSDYATIKYNSLGTELWVQRYNGPGNSSDEASSIAVDGLGNVYVTGFSSGSGTGYDYATIKYNSSGVQQWVQRYNGPGNNADYAFSLAVDGSGNVYVTGESWSGSTFNTGDYATIKYNSSGVEQWVQRYNGPGNGWDVSFSLTVDASGNSYVTGWSYVSGANYDYATIKYNSSGVQQWVQRYNGPGNDGDAAYSIAVDGLGNVYVTGGSIGSGTSSDYATIKYNSSGVQQWVQRYNGPGNGIDQANSIAVDPLGNNVYVTGSSVGSGTSDDYATIKYNALGNQQWVQRYNGPGNSKDWAYSLALDPESLGSNVYVTGFSRSGSSSSTEDYATIKYSQAVGIQPVSSEIPGEFSLYQNYPNPFNPVTKIRFSLPHPSEGGAQDAKLIIFDAIGRAVVTLVKEQLKPGTYEVVWDGSNYPSGVYYYTLKAGNYTATKKLVLLK
jgi:uncharacterized delta-60 repeat protein